jgi:mannose-1-phosphate guanylyltransferase
VLLGAVPEKPDTELGWIELGDVLPSPPYVTVSAVSRFLEKPDTGEAERVMNSGGLLNTLVIACRLKALWNLGRRHFPETLELLEQAADAFDTDGEEAALEGIYQHMPSWNVSSDFLGRSAASLAVMQLQGVAWSDWGKPERILNTCRRQGEMWLELGSHFQPVANRPRKTLGNPKIDSDGASNHEMATF